MTLRTTFLLLYFSSLAAFSNAQTSDIHPARFSEPPTVTSHQHQAVRELSIDEAVLLALDHNPYLTTLRYRPEILQTQIRQEASIFDPTIGGSAFYGRSDNPLTSQITSAGTTATSQTVRRFDAHPDHDGNLEFAKRLPNGALASLQYELDAESIDPVGNFRIVNPAWRSGISAVIEQPLRRGAGVSVNRAKIHIAQHVYQQSKREIQAAMNQLALQVRISCWELAFARDCRLVQEQARERAELTLEQESKRSNIGASHRANVAQATELLQRVRIASQDALQKVVRSERLLRTNIGLDGFDGTQLQPIETEYDHDALNWEQALHIFLERRPEITAQRHKIQSARIEVQRLCNQMQPDVSVLGRLSTTGLGTAPDVAFGNSLEFDHGEAAVGISYRQSVNRTSAKASLRRAQLILAQEQAVLRQLEYDFSLQLQGAYQAVIANGERTALMRARHEAAIERLETSREQFRSLNTARVDYLLRAQESLTNAELAMAQGKLAYRTAMENWTFHSGGLIEQWSNSH